MRPMLPGLALLTLPATATAAKITLSEDAWINAGGYVQAWAYAGIDTEEGGVAPDLYLRRAYVIVNGQPTKKTTWYFAALASNLGKAGDPATLAVNVSDAWFEYKHADAFILTTGVFRVPISHQELVGGSSIHGLDFHSAFVTQPTPISMRDVGVQARGYLLDQHVEYRLALFDGSEPNPLNAPPRVVARACWHALDADTGLTVKGAYLGKKKMLDIGASFDLEPVTAAEELAWAAAADVFADVPLGENGITATAEFQLHGPDGVIPEGMGAWGDVGYRIRKVEPLVAAEWYQPAEGDAGQRLALMGGVNWWIREHDATLKLQGGATQKDGADTWAPEIIVQGQVVF